MDESALLVIGVIVAGTELVKRLALKLFNFVIDDGLTQVVAIVVALAILFLGQETVWAATALIGEHPLKDLGTADIVFASVAFGLGSNFVDRGVRTIANIGENNEDPPE